MTDESVSGKKLGPTRREFLIAGMGAVAAPVMAQSTTTSNNTESAATAAANTGKSSVRAFGAASATAPVQQIKIDRRSVGPKDVLLDVLYCGICHSDVHQLRDDWSDWGPTVYPCVPGHEIIGRVVAVGNEVTKFKVGDIGGVGCMVDSCRECDQCNNDQEQYCEAGMTGTYNGIDKHGTAPTTYGGYSDRIVVTEHFVIRIPPGADLAATAPLLCAGITTFSPMQHWDLKGGQRVGVVGLGGLGHVAVKLAVARGADVTVFTTSLGKIEDAKRMGAKEAILSTDEVAMNRLVKQFDLIISTVPVAYSMNPFINLLKTGATFVNVGISEDLEGITGINLISARRSVAASMIGGIAETQQVIDYCAARNIKADIELVQPDQINPALDRVVNKDVKFRFVIDMVSTKTKNEAEG